MLPLIPLTTDDAVWHDEIVYTGGEYRGYETKGGDNCTDSTGKTSPVSVKQYTG